MTKQKTETHRKPAPSRKGAPAPTKLAAPKPVSGNSQTRLTPEEIEQMIAAAAYVRAEKRGFEPGHELGDWFAAEREVKARLAAGLSTAMQ